MKNIIIVCACLLIIGGNLRSQNIKFGEFDHQEGISLPSNTVEILNIVDLNNDGKDDYIITVNIGNNTKSIEMYLNFVGNKLIKFNDNPFLDIKLSGFIYDIIYPIYMNSEYPDLVLKHNDNTLLYRSDGNGKYEDGVILVDDDFTLYNISAIELEGKIQIYTSLKSKYETANFIFVYDEFGKLNKFRDIYFDVPEKYTDFKSIDLNNDGYKDFVFYTYSDSVLIYLNEGNGYYKKSKSFLMKGYNTKFQDLNYDGYIDITSMNSQYETREIYMYMNDSTGSFDSEKIIEIPRERPYYDYYLDDYNLDGIFDVTVFDYGEALIESYISTNIVNVFENIYSSEVLPIKINPSNCHLFDFNGDSQLDILLSGISVAGQNNKYKTEVLVNNNGVLRNITESPLAWESYYPSSEIERELDIFDYDQDGDEDIFFWKSNQIKYDTTQFLKIYTNNGKAIFNLNPNIPLQSSSIYTDYEWADMNGDGYIDLVAGTFDYSDIPNAKPRVLLNDGNFNFEYDFFRFRTNINISQNDSFIILDVKVGKINNDDNADVVAFFSSFGYLLLENIDNRQLKILKNEYIENRNYSRIELPDLNNDGYSDLVLYEANTKDMSSVSVEINDGFGNFTSVRPDLFSDLKFTTLLLEDYNNDKLIDIIAINEENSYTETLIFENIGNGDFITKNMDLLSIYRDLNIDFADINNDSYTDIIGLSKSRSTGRTHLFVLVNEGNGNYTRNFIGEYYINKVSNFQVKDLDGDGLPDLIVKYDGKVDIRKNLSGKTTIVNQGKEDLYKVYPLPFSNRININSKMNSIISNIKVYNLDSKLISDNSYKSSNLSFELNVETGVYLLEITELNGKKSLIKVIRE